MVTRAWLAIPWLLVVPPADASPLAAQPGGEAVAPAPATRSDAVRSSLVRAWLPGSPESAGRDAAADPAPAIDLSDRDDRRIRLRREAPSAPAVPASARVEELRGDIRPRAIP